MYHLRTHAEVEMDETRATKAQLLENAFGHVRAPGEVQLQRRWTQKPCRPMELVTGQTETENINYCHIELPSSPTL